MSFRKKFLLILLGITAILTMPLSVMAQTISTPQLPTLTLNDLPTNLPEVLSKVVGSLLYFVGTVAVLFLIVAGLQFIIAAGNPEGVEKAKSAAINVVIGLAIIILSNVLVKFVINIFYH
jgi:hypothetical protein